MRDFLDTKLFGATCVGVATLAICHDLPGWQLVALPSLCMALYWVVLQWDIVPAKRNAVRAPSRHGLLNNRESRGW